MYLPNGWRRNWWSGGGRSSGWCRWLRNARRAEGIVGEGREDLAAIIVVAVSGCRGFDQVRIWFRQQRLDERAQVGPYGPRS